MPLLSAAALRPCYGDRPNESDGGSHARKERVSVRAFAVQVQIGSSDRGKRYLFCIHSPAAFRAMDATRICVETNETTLVWHGDRFTVTHSFYADWKISGVLDDRVVSGYWGSPPSKSKPKAFVGSEVGYSTYTFPIEPDEVIVAMKCLCDSGFLFEVVGPESLRGQCVTAHHDGLLASGPVEEIAEPGHTYLWRAQRDWIGATNYNLCSVFLKNRIEVGKDSIDPRYRPATVWLGDLLHSSRLGGDNCEPAPAVEPSSAGAAEDR